jgi:hypothetical protein
VYQLKGLEIAFISVYQAVWKSHQGLTSVHAQHTALLATEDRQIDPCQEFTMDLLDTVRNLTTEVIMILLAGYFNRSDENSGILMQLQDEWHLPRVNDQTGIASYWQGRHFIDHSFATYKVSNALTRL